MSRGRCESWLEAPRSLVTRLSVCVAAVLGCTRGSCDVPDARLAAAYTDAREALEQELGVKLAATIPLRMATESEIAEIVAEENRRLTPRIETDPQMARAMTDRSAAQRAESALAKYAWSTREILIRADRRRELYEASELPDAAVDFELRAILVHELVHAWDDEVHGLANCVERLDSVDAASALDAVVEGHAQHVARRVCAARGWQADFERMTARLGALPKATERFDEADRAPFREAAAHERFLYHDGERFIAALESLGGADSIARVFREPPRDAETILHPEWYLDPSLRPASMYDTEPALDAFARRFREPGWTAYRWSPHSGLLLTQLSPLSPDETPRLVAPLRRARSIVLEPLDPGAWTKSAALLTLEFATADDARAYVDATEKIADSSTDSRRVGNVRVASSTVILLNGDQDSCANGELESDPVEITHESIVAARDRIVLRTTLSDLGIDASAHAEFVEKLFDVVKPRPPK